MSQLWDDDSAEGSLWSRSFDFDDCDDGDDVDCSAKGEKTKKTLSLLVEEEWNAGIGGTCWEGGVLLARFLSSPAFTSLQGLLPTDRPLRAIELGSGVSALPCLVAARLTRRRAGKTAGKEKEAKGDESGGGDGGESEETSSSSSSSIPLFSEIFATDIDECLPGLKANAVKNAPIGTRVEVVKCEEEEEEGEEKEEAEEIGEAAKAEEPSSQTLKLLDLDWRLFPRASAFLKSPFDVVLIADAVYISELMPALVEAMRSVSDEKSTVLLAYFLRSESADRRFWPRLRAAFAVEHVPAVSFGCEGADKGEGRGLFRLRKRGEEEYRELERRRAEEEEEGEEAAAEKEGEQEENK